jgi:thiol-disulfide isomerase/thioredoxin
MGEPKPLWIIVGIGLLALITLVSCEPDGITPDWKRLESPIPAPDFTLPKLDGGALHFADLRGRMVIMEFWATWCGPCRYSMPSLEVISRQYRDRGVQVLFVNQGETAEQVRQWAGKRFTSPILLDQDGRVGSAYGVTGIPRLLIINPEGQILYDHAGYGGGLERSLKTILEELLGSSALGYDA